MSKNIYSKDHQRLVQKLKDARVEAGLSQQDAAELLGKTQSYLSKVEAGQRQVDIVELKDFARAYKKKVVFFI